MYGLSFGTVHRLVHGLSEPGTKNGRPTVLPPAVEEALAKKLTRLCEAHMHVEMALLPLIAEDIAKGLGIETGSWVAGKKWIAGFLKRHPTLSSRRCGKISRARGIHFNSYTHTEWTDAVGPVVALYKPEETGNCDDTGVSVEHSSNGVRVSIPPSTRTA